MLSGRTVVNFSLLMSAEEWKRLVVQVVVPVEFVQKAQMDVFCSKVEVNGELTVNESESENKRNHERWTVCGMSRVKGCSHHVDYDRRLEVQYHTHPLATLIETAMVYRTSMRRRVRMILSC